MVQSKISKLTMNTEQNKAIVRRFNGAFSDHNLEVIGEILHQNYSVRAGTDVPWATVLQGKENAKKGFEQMLQDNPTFQITIENIIAEGDKVL
jgi:ketosteroid isomerase-like protein